MIKILDSLFNRLGVVKNTISATRSEEINGENTLDFEAVLNTKLSGFIGDTTCFELDDEWFDIAFYTSSANEDNTYTISVESEHVSYRLNRAEYDMEYFAQTGTPAYILGQILAGTGFTIDAIEYTDVLTYSAQEKKSRRQLLMEFAAYLGGDLIFHKFGISIVRHRGSSETRLVIKDRNVKVVSKTVNKREKDKDGNPVVSYKCQPTYLPGDEYAIGDNIRLIQPMLSTDQDLRVVRISRDPYDSMSVTLEFSKYASGLGDSLYNIETTTIQKGKFYNGTRIGPDFGFESVRGDKKARAYFRSDAMAFQSGDGTGDNWRDRLYFEYDSATDQTSLVFDGVLSVDMITALSEELRLEASEVVLMVRSSQEYTGDLADITAYIDTQIDVQDQQIQIKADKTYVDEHDSGLQAAADSAAEAASNANLALLAIASDNKLTPGEKKITKLLWDSIESEAPQNLAQGTTFGLTDERAAYNTKYLELGRFLNNDNPWTSGTPSMIDGINLAQTSTIDGNGYRLAFKNYYDARTVLMNAAANKAREAANEAQVTADQAILELQPDSIRLKVGRIGGDNFVRNGRCDSGMSYWTVLGAPVTSIGTSSALGGKKVFTVVTDAANEFMRQTLTGLIPETKYTCSALIGIDYGIGMMQVYNGESYAGKSKTVIGGYTLESFTFTAKASQVTLFIGSASATPASVKFTDVKVEEGENATAWTDCSTEMYDRITSAEIALQPDNIRLSVGQPGGSNLLFNSSFRKLPPASSRYGSPSAFGNNLAPNDNNYIKIVQGTATAFGYVTEGNLNLVAGRTYTLLFDAGTDGSLNLNYIYIMSAANGNVKLPISFAVTPTIQTYRATFVPAVSYTDAKILIGANVSPANAAVIRLRRVALFEGDTASWWTPNPNEIQNTSMTITDDTVKIDTKNFDLILRDAANAAMLTVDATSGGMLFEGVADDGVIRKVNVKGGYMDCYRMYNSAVHHSTQFSSMGYRQYAYWLSGDPEILRLAIEFDNGNSSDYSTENMDGVLSFTENMGHFTIKSGSIGNILRFRHAIKPYAGGWTEGLATFIQDVYFKGHKLMDVDWTNKIQCGSATSHATVGTGIAVTFPVPFPSGSIVRVSLTARSNATVYISTAATATGFAFRASAASVVTDWIAVAEE